MSNPDENINLSPTPQRAADKIVDLIEAPTSKFNRLIIVEGMSGVGKTAVLEAVRAEVVVNDGVILPEGELGGDTAKQIKEAKNIVVPSTVRADRQHKKTYRNLTRLLPRSVTTDTIVLPGFTQEEIEELAPRNYSGTLPLDRAVYFSMGVPLLMRRLSGANDENEALGIASRQLHGAFGSVSPKTMVANAAKYLQMPVPSEALQNIEWLGNSRHVYDGLNHAYTKQAELATQGIEEESPAFVAPESEKIYDAMLQSDEYPSIDIFIPGLSAEDFARLQQAFGYVKRDTYYGEQEGYLSDEATRMQMFGTNYRKVSFWHRDVSGNECEQENEYYELRDMVEGYQEAFEQGRLGLDPNLTDDDLPASMYVHVHEHHGMNWHAASIGWMVESLLQQRGIPYFVNNATYGASYAFNRETRHIKELPEQVKIQRW